MKYGIPHQSVLIKINFVGCYKIFLQISLLLLWIYNTYVCEGFRMEGSGGEGDLSDYGDCGEETGGEEDLMSVALHTSEITAQLAAAGMFLIVKIVVQL